MFIVPPINNASPKEFTNSAINLIIEVTGYFPRKPRNAH